MGVPTLGYVRQMEVIEMGLQALDLDEVLLQSFILCLQLPVYLSHNESLVREHVHGFSTQFLDH